MRKSLLYSSLIILSILLILLSSQFLNFQLFSPVQINVASNLNQLKVISNSTSSSNLTANFNNSYILKIRENDNLDSFSNLIHSYLAVAYLIDILHENKILTSLLLQKNRIYILHLPAGEYALVMNLEIISPASSYIPVGNNSKYDAIVNLRYNALTFAMYSNLSLTININAIKLTTTSVSFYSNYGNTNSNIINVQKFYVTTLPYNSASSNFIATIFYIDSTVVAASNNLKLIQGNEIIYYDQSIYPNGFQVNISNIRYFDVLAFFQSTSLE